MKLLLIGVCLLIVFSYGEADAQVGTNGGAIINVYDGSDHGCVDASKNLVSLMLVSAQLQRSQSWWSALFKSKAALGVKFDVSIENSQGTSFNFPRAKQLAVSSTRSDVGYLPMRFPIMSKYPLVDDKNVVYKNTSIDLYLMSLEKGSAAFSDVMAFVDFSSALPLPPNPYITGMEYFGKFAQKIVNGSLSSGADKYPVASFSFDLAANADQAKPATCPSTALREGVQAVVFDYKGKLSDDMISIADTRKYCFWYNAPTSNIVFKARNAAQCPATMPEDAKSLGNPLVVFTVSAWALPNANAKPPAEMANNQTPSNVGAIPSDASIANFVTTTKAHSPVNFSINPEIVKDLFSNFTQAKTSASQRFDQALKNATPADVSAALALKRCAIVGVPPAECL
ncbi:hypothetical protein [Burkholderia pyrrocinia]|uniref:hypothetical protein n=1 Tax=Burkholderia pyrrocinia TaxID=60550 RepID=UPI000A934B3B|nr:hypothetical protein [Burkholderia pyrrocinia]